MLVIANGAFKSGSTWQREILVNLMEFEQIPSDYAMLTLPHWIDPAKLPQFVENVDIHSSNYITKSHLLSQRFVDLLVGRDDVRVLNIRRDVKDVVVSHYHHLLRLGKCPKDFRAYYYRIGRYKSYQLRLYHQMWTIPGVYCSSFESLKTDFNAEVARIAEFVDVPVTEEQIAAIAEATSLTKLRDPKTTKDQSRLPDKSFFRSGEVGGWKDYFDEQMAADVEAIESDGLKGWDLLKYHAMFSVRVGIKLALSNRYDWLDALVRKV